MMDADFEIECSALAVQAFPILRADERELREFARANLAHFKAPRT